MPPNDEQTTTMAIFEGFTIRQVWHDEEWFFSVIDVIAALTESTNPRKYWDRMKARILDAAFVRAMANCLPLKLITTNGKTYLTDCSNVQKLLHIIHAIPAKRRGERGKYRSDDSRKCGIYAISHVNTGNCYIGSSTDIQTRYAQHSSLLRRGKHPALRLQTDWDQYGEEAFVLIILEEVPDGVELRTIEQHYIDEEAPVYNTDFTVKALSLRPVEEARVQRLIACLRQQAGIASQGAYATDIQFAIDFGMVVPGPNYYLVSKAEMAGVTTWEALRGFLLNQ
jgi:hypothetical protein